MNKFLSILVFLFVGGIGFMRVVADSSPLSMPQKPLWNATYVDKLKRDLLMTYDKFARPAEHFNQTTVNFSMTFQHVDLDERESVLHVYCWIVMRWNDEKLKWNKSDYGNISVLHVGVHEIWQPDILLYNSAAGGNLDYLGNTNLVVHDTGKVLWVPPAHLQVFCDIDLHHWPYDTHECYLKFGSWTLSNAEIELSIDEKLVVDMDRLVKNSEWEVQTYSGERRLTLYQSVDEAYVDVTINLTLSRRSPMYRTVVTVPAIVIILLTLGSFWLPADHGERILLNGINAVIIVMFLVYFAEKLNVMAMHTPLIVTFYSNTLYMVCFSILISVVVLNLTRMRYNCIMPWAIKKVLDGPLGNWLFLHNISLPQSQSQFRGEELRDAFDEPASADDRQIIQQHDKQSVHNDWIRLGVAIDRTAFVLYAMIFFISAVACI